MNRRKVLIALSLFTALLPAWSLRAQDLHFSQFYNAPLVCNPANTGFIPDADYRAGANYRRQWASIPVPYKTMSAFGDMQVLRDKFYNGWFGVGLSLMNDEAGTAALQSTRVYGSVAYHQMIGQSSLLSGGFKGGWVSKRINTSKLTFDDQWNGKFFDIQAPTGEVLATNNIGYFDLHAGINYAYFPNENSYINMGVSMQHINRPRESFFDGISPTGNAYDNRLARRLTFFANGSFKLNDMVIVNPQAYYSRMAAANELVAGANVHYNLSGDGATQIIGGAYYRLNDALIPMAGLKYKSMQVVFTYDATMSGLNQFNGYRGGSEISIIHQGIFNSYNGPRNTGCKMPAF
jgi:type IX secretion system PorP/SprF family membrane protein